MVGGFTYPVRGQVLHKSSGSWSLVKMRVSHSHSTTSAADLFWSAQSRLTVSADRRLSPTSGVSRFPLILLLISPGRTRPMSLFSEAATEWFTPRWRRSVGVHGSLAARRTRRGFPEGTMVWLGSSSCLQMASCGSRAVGVGNRPEFSPTCSQPNTRTGYPRSSEVADPLPSGFGTVETCTSSNNSSTRVVSDAQRGA